MREINVTTVSSLRESHETRHDQMATQLDELLDINCGAFPLIYRIQRFCDK